jgi:hypothetical protein
LSSITDQEKVDIRRFCGYPAYGAAPTGMQSWRFFQAYGLLEFRMENLSETECGVARRHITALETIEISIPLSSGNLDSDEVAVWRRNRTEVLDRLHLFDEWCRRLCSFLGVPPGPGLAGSQPILVV